MTTRTKETLPGSETAKKLGLLPEEYEKIQSILGRDPNFTELSIYSVMWSEHCSYKNSINWLKKLPKEGENVLAGAGEENAGLMDIGDGLAVAFKIESHNHPSAIEPYQGAATGVGGIQRDIFTMGARPVCSLNSLRFGDPGLARTRHLVKGVVKGIGDYGNSFGIPTVAGEIYFDECYNTNPLVNAMSVGIVETGMRVSATSTGVGNPVFIVGSATGRDGIHGATFASEDIHEDSHKDLPSVQVGDPFTEKLLLEATLEIIRTGAVIGMQDMGAAGITCSTSEMSEKGKHGMDIWLDLVPTWESGMKPFEILLSESQERMLVVIEKGRETEISSIFEKWDLNCVQIGVVTQGPMLRYTMFGECVAEIPAESLVLGGGAPVYEREQKRPSYMDEIDAFDSAKIPQPEVYRDVAEFLVSQPSISSKKWLTQQYDSMVGRVNLSTNQPSDAAVVNILGTKKALAVTTDCNSRYVFSDPETGCALAVCEAARNIACAGGTPLGITNCLNFGNPYNPEVYFQFANSILGMKKACEKFGIPVTGGNVSFYNQSSFDGPVYPTPTIGMVGFLQNAEKQKMSLDFKSPTDLIYLLGINSDDIACSEYCYSWHKVRRSPAPAFDLESEFKVVHSLLHLIGENRIRSAHDVSDGGLMVTMLESAFPRQLGFELGFYGNMRKDGFLFGEAGGRIVVSIKPEDLVEFEDTTEALGVPFAQLGWVRDDGKVVVDGENWGGIEFWKELYENSLGKKLGMIA